MNWTPCRQRKQKYGWQWASYVQLSFFFPVCDVWSVWSQSCLLICQIFSSTKLFLLYCSTKWLIHPSLSLQELSQFEKLWASWRPQLWTRCTKTANTHLQTGDSEVCYETNNFRVVFYFDQLPQLVVTLQPRQQTTELMVVIRIWQTLKYKQVASKNLMVPQNKQKKQSSESNQCV